MENRHFPTTIHTIGDDLRPLLRILRRRWWLILLTVVICGVSSYAAARFLVTPRYRSAFSAYVNNCARADQRSSLTSSDLSASRALAKTYSAILLSRTVLEQAAEQAGAEYSYETLQRCVSADVTEETGVITVSVVSDSPERSCALAEAVAAVITEVGPTIVEGSSVRVYNLPRREEVPFAPRPVRIGLCGALVGTLLVLLVLPSLAVFNHVLLDESPLEECCKLPVLGVIPQWEDTQKVRDKYGYRYGYGSRKKADGGSSKKAPKKPDTAGKTDAPEKDGFAAMRLGKDSPFTFLEAFKALRTNLSFSMIDKQVLGIISPEQHEGKSSIAVNLGIAYGQIGKKVLVVDCDLRRPTVAQKLGVSPRPGFTNYLIGRSDFAECIRHVAGTEAAFMPAGTIPPDPSVILHSAAMDRFLETAKHSYELIIFDLPPIGAVADAAMLAGHGVDAFLMIVRHGVTDLRQVEEALRRMRLVGARPLGFVYNGKPLSK